MNSRDNLATNYPRHPTAPLFLRVPIPPFTTPAAIAASPKSTPTASILFTPSWERRTAQRGYLNANPSSRWPPPLKTRFLSQINSHYNRWENHHSLAYRARSGHSLLPSFPISFSVPHDTAVFPSPTKPVYTSSLCRHTVREQSNVDIETRNPLLNSFWVVPVDRGPTRCRSPAITVVNYKERSRKEEKFGDFMVALCNGRWNLYSGGRGYDEAWISWGTKNEPATAWRSY